MLGEALTKESVALLTVSPFAWQVLKVIMVSNLKNVLI